MLVIDLKELKSWRKVKMSELDLEKLADEVE